MKLTDKEKKIISLIGKALTNNEIAKRVGIKSTSIGVYIYNMCRICGAKNRIDLYNKFVNGEIN